MKRLLVVISISILVVSGIVGCGIKKENLALNIYSKSIQAMEQANSYAFTMNIGQSLHMPIADQQEIINMNMTMEGKLVENPMSMEMTIDVDMGDALAPELAELNNSSMQYYVKDQKVYMLNPLLGDIWLVEPVDNLGEIGFELDPTYIASSFGGGAELAKVTEHGRFYVLTIESTDKDDLKETFSKMIEDILINSGTGFHASETETILDKTTINQLSLKLWIDKETYLQESIDMELKIEINYEDYSLEIEQKVLANFKQFGEFPTIDVPKEVIEKAVSLDTFLMNSIPISSQ